MKTALKIRSQMLAGWKVALAYKFDFLVQLITNPISVIVYYFLWKAIYAYTGLDVISGYTFQQLIDYFVFSLIVGMIVYSDIDNWMEHNVVHGNVIQFFLKPISYLAEKIWFEVGLKFLDIVIVALPLIMIAITVFGTKLATSLPMTLLSFLMLILAVIIGFMMTYLTGLIAFWLIRIHGLRRMKRAFLLFLSGGIIPLTFFPSWYQQLSHFLPFEYMRFVPINAYMGRYSITATGFDNVFIVLGMQILWVVVLYLIAKFVEMQAFKKFSGAGA